MNTFNKTYYIIVVSLIKSINGKKCNIVYNIVLFELRIRKLYTFEENICRIDKLCTSVVFVHPFIFLILNLQHRHDDSIASVSL